jgi:hypothetical protein
MPETMVDLMIHRWTHGDAHQRKTVRDALSLFPPPTRAFLCDLIETELAGQPAALEAFLQQVAYG